MASDIEDVREMRIRELFPMVRKIARRVRRLVPSVDIDDLVGDGCIGLIRAVDHFDPTRGPTLEHYAGRVIAGAMLNGIRRMDPVSERARRAVREGETTRYRIALERGSVPTIEEIEIVHPGFARALVTAYRSQPLSLDAPLPEGESLGEDWGADPANHVEERLQAVRLREAVHALPDRQRNLIHEHYFGGQSLRTIGKKMRISAQRASQLHIAAMKRMRKALRAAAH